jgi:hypothetical protein
MRIGRLTWPSEAAAAPAGRPVPRRQRHGIEYVLIVAIIGFAGLSTFNAISAKHGSPASERAAVRYQ